MIESSFKNIKSIVKKYDYSRQKLIFMLHDIQKFDDENYISEKNAQALSGELNVPIGEIYEVISFYSMFNEKPKGKYIIEICNSGPCFVRNSKTILLDLQDVLDIKVGETTKDGLFTLQFTSCIGACDISPAMKIGDIVYGNLTREKIEYIVDEYKGERVCAAQ